jgi:hypothetical protein
MTKETVRISPGPATYTLPSVFGYEDHDITVTRNPAYTFGETTLESGRRRPDPCYIKPGETGFEKPYVPVPSERERRALESLVHKP